MQQNRRFVVCSNSQILLLACRSPSGVKLHGMDCKLSKGLL